MTSKTRVSKYRALPVGYYQNHYISFMEEQKVPVSDTTYYVIGQITHLMKKLVLKNVAFNRQYKIWLFNK